MPLEVVDDGCCRAGLAVGLLAAKHVERVMQSVERAVMLPAAEIVINGAARRQVFWHRAPLAASAQHIHQAVHHLAYVHYPLVAAPLGARDLRFGQTAFLIGQVAGIAQIAAVIPGAVLDSPNLQAPTNQAAARES